MKPELLKETVQRAEELGVERSSRMLSRALAVVAFVDKEVIDRRIQLLHNLGFSKDDVLAVVRKQPLVLGLSEQKIQGNVDFLTKDVGLELSYIVRRPVLLMYSVERRLLPRHCLLKVLREKGLVKGKPDCFGTASIGEKIFVEKYVRPFKNHVPGLTDDYASKCWRKAMDGIRSQKTD